MVVHMPGLQLQRHGAGAIPGIDLGPVANHLLATGFLDQADLAGITRR